MVSTNTYALSPRPRRLPYVLGLYWIVLFAATHWPNPWPGGEGPKYPDKLVHGTAYFGLTVLLTATLGIRVGGAWGRWAICYLIVAAYGLADEFTQPWVGRDFDWHDWRADLIGAALGVLLVAAWPRRRRASKS